MWMAAVLAALAALLAAAATQEASIHRSAEQRERRTALIWAARAGMEVAAERLLRDPTKYNGETWDERGIRVEIRVASRNDAYHVSVQANHAPSGRSVALERYFRRVGPKDRPRLEAAPVPPIADK
jgi:type II secretory pathway component PulK